IALAYHPAQIPLAIALVVVLGWAMMASPQVGWREKRSRLRSEYQLHDLARGRLVSRNRSAPCLLPIEAGWPTRETRSSIWGSELPLWRRPVSSRFLKS